MIWTKKNLLFTGIALFLFILIIELFSIVLVYFKFKSSHPIFAEAGYSATSFIVKKAINEKIFPRIASESFEPTISYPYPFFIPDPLHGFKSKPGLYDFIFRKKNDGKITQYKSKITIKNDGYRFVGNSNDSTNANIFVFGDSFVFGEGVNDEQTFTFLLQQEFKELKFHLLATGGWSLSNALINVEALKESFKKNDLLVLGYADFYKARHTAGPSRIKEFGDPKSFHAPDIKHLRYRIDKDQRLVRDYVSIFCKNNIDYCSENDPTDDEMDLVTAKIINTIARTTDAKVILLHFSGSAEDKVFNMLDSRIEVVSATEDSFSYKIRDNVLGLDNHPGPYWHYAIFTRIAEIIKREYPK